MAASIRKSTFRHVEGVPEQSKNIYRDIRFGNSGVDVQPLKASGSHFAVPYTANGSLSVVSLSQQGALDHESLAYFVHPDQEQLLDFDFSPHHDTLLASVHQNGECCLWQADTLVQDGKSGGGQPPRATLRGHSKRLMQLSWHPNAEQLLVTVDAGKLGKLWDVAAEREVVSELAGSSSYKGLVSSLNWTGDGKLLVTYAKDKKLRLIDVRANEVVACVDDHDGAKAGQALSADKAGRILTFGFTRMQGRSYSLWDPRQMGARVVNKQLDTNSAAFLPLLDQDTSVLFLGSRGEGTIRCYDVAGDDLHALSEFKSVEATSGLAALPKSACNVEKNEIRRLLKLTPKRTVVPIRFEVPRQDSFFHEDIFPLTWDGKPTCSADEWLQGNDTARNLISLDPEQ